MIWCVEDDASIRDIEVYTLSSTGFDARGFEDGVSFWSALQTEKPDLVVLDVMLPGVDGIELLQRMKASAELRTIPVVMATAKGAEYDKIRGLDLGAADAVKGDLQRLHIPADRLHGLLFEHPGEQGHQLLLAFSGELVLLGLLRGEFLRGLLLGRHALDLQPGILRRERSLLIGKVHLHVPGRVLLRFRNLLPGGRLDPGTFGARRSLLAGNPLRGGLLRRRFGGGRLRHGGFRGRGRNLRNGFFRSGGRLRSRSCGGHFGFRDSDSHGRIRLRIFSRRADLLLGSRKCRFFSSHFSTRFWFPHVREHINLANITIFPVPPNDFAGNLLTSQKICAAHGQPVAGAPPKTH